MDQFKQLIAENGYYFNKRFREVIKENKWYYSIAKADIDRKKQDESSTRIFVADQLKHYDDLLQTNIFFIYGLRCGLKENDKTIGAIVTELNRKPEINITTDQQIVDTVFNLIIGGNIAFIISYLHSLNGKEFEGYDTESLISKWNLKLSGNEVTGLDNESETATLELGKMKNNFDHIDITTVYKHFKSKLVDKGILSELVLLQFIEAAFHKKQPFAENKKLSFSTIANKKQVIRRAFHLYYTDVAMKPHGSKSKYVSLLTDFFEGFKHNTAMTNFAR